MIKLYFQLILVLCLAAGCSLGSAEIINSSLSPQQATSPVADDSEMGLASEALGKYLDSLSQGWYHKTPGYYGGTYEVLENLNKDVQPDFKQKLWEKFCLANNGVCLDYILVNKKLINPGEYQFTVQYLKKDGSLYVTGGCACKGGGTDEFDFSVKKIDGQFLVTSLPPRQNQ